MAAVAAAITGVCCSSWHVTVCHLSMKPSPSEAFQESLRKLHATLHCVEGMKSSTITFGVEALGATSERR